MAKFTDKQILERIIKILSEIEEPITCIDIVSAGIVKKVYVNQPTIEIYLRNIYRTSRSPAAMLMSAHIMERIAKKIEKQLLENRLTGVKILEEKGDWFS